MELVGTEQPMRSLDRIAGHVAAGLVECGLLIGSSILCTADAPQCLPGLTVPGAVGFTLAAILGVRLVWDALHRGK